MDDAEQRKLEEHADALNERLDRFFAFRRPTEQTLEDRVQLLEREVVLLFRLVATDARTIRRQLDSRTSSQATRRGWHRVGTARAFPAFLARLSRLIEPNPPNQAR